MTPKKYVTRELDQYFWHILIHQFSDNLEGNARTDTRKIFWGIDCVDLGATVKEEILNKE